MKYNKLWIIGFLAYKNPGFNLLQLLAGLKKKMGQAFGCIQVDQSNVAITEKFGKFDDVLEPGCHCLPWCFGYQVAGGLSLRVQQLDVTCETKTKVNSYTFFPSN